jgi:hypothetical protein
MTVTYDLECVNGHHEESYFASLEAYQRLKDAGHLLCGRCSAPTAKLVSAPAIIGLRQKGGSPGFPAHPNQGQVEVVGLLVIIPRGVN